jgi:hypothetical protein
MHVAVVDPGRTVLNAVSRLLAKDSHAVSTFVDGPEALAHIDQLLKRADSALYHAKTGGRHRVIATGRPAAKTDAACVSDVLWSTSWPKHDDRSKSLNESTASGRVTRLLVAQPGGLHVVAAAKRN